MKLYLFFLPVLVFCSFTIMVTDDSKIENDSIVDGVTYIQFDTLDFNISNKMTRQFFSDQPIGSEYRYEKFNP